jgi:hypothetical protein
METTPTQAEVTAGPLGISSIVNELAADHDVSERTIWRWLKLAQNNQPSPLNTRLTNHRELPGFSCRHCNQPLPPRSSRRRRYCTPHCRIAHHRAQAKSRLSLARSPRSS